MTNAAVVVVLNQLGHCVALNETRVTLRNIVTVHLEVVLMIHGWMTEKCVKYLELI